MVQLTLAICTGNSCQVSICPQRYFFQPIDSARSRKDWRSIIMPYLRMRPFWFPVTRQRRQPGPYFLGCVFVRLVMAVSYLSIVLEANDGATWIDQQTHIPGSTDQAVGAAE